MEYSFDELENADLVIDAIYKGGTTPNMSAEPFHKLIPRCENSGGFRKKLREDGSGKYAYIVLYTSMEELEWPDYLDEETGILRYYSDNREPGRELTDTKKHGNKILELVFGLLNEEREMLKTDLIKVAKISTNAMAKLGKNEDVRIGVLVKICETLDCKLDDIVEIEK